MGPVNSPVIAAGPVPQLVEDLPQKGGKLAVRIRPGLLAVLALLSTGGLPERTNGLASKASARGSPGAS